MKITQLKKILAGNGVTINNVEKCGRTHKVEVSMNNGATMEFCSDTYSKGVWAFVKSSFITLNDNYIVEEFLQYIRYRNGENLVSTLGESEIVELINLNK